MNSRSLARFIIIVFMCLICSNNVLYRRFLVSEMFVNFATQKTLKNGALSLTRVSFVILWIIYKNRSWTYLLGEWLPTLGNRSRRTPCYYWDNT